MLSDLFERQEFVFAVKGTPKISHELKNSAATAGEKTKKREETIAYFATLKEAENFVERNSKPSHSHEDLRIECLD